MKKKAIIGITIIVALACAGWYGYSEYNRKVRNLRNVKTDLYMTAPELISAFEKNEAVANANYLDKVIGVKGIVKGVEKNEHGHYTVVLDGKEGMSSVRCSMDSSFQHEVVSMKEGAAITMKGACTGFNADELLGSDVILNRCVIETK